MYMYQHIQIILAYAYQMSDVKQFNISSLKMIISGS